MIPLILRMRFIILLIVPLLFLWLISLREVRLKIGDYYYNRGKFDQAANSYEKAVRKEQLRINEFRGDRLQHEEDLSKLVSSLRQQGDYYFKQGNFDHASNWYEKLVMRERLKIDQDRGDRLKYKEDLTKLESSLLRKMEEKLLIISHILGFGGNKDFESLLTDPKFFLKDISELTGIEPKEKLYKAKEELVIFDNASDNYRNFLGKNIKSKELDYLVPIGYFFKGIIDEVENNFISADSNFMRAANSYPEVSNIVEERRKKIFYKKKEIVQYIGRSLFFEKTGSFNVLLESEFPLIVTGTVPGVDNFLCYRDSPAENPTQKYTLMKYEIRGEVVGKETISCILPRVVFWGANEKYLGETTRKYRIRGKFNISFSFFVPNGTLSVTPRITFDGSCFSEGQRILIQECKWD